MQHGYDARLLPAMGVSLGALEAGTAETEKESFEKPDVHQLWDTVGNVELENIGFSGTPADRRSYSDDQLAGALKIVEEYAVLLDQLGFDTLWLAEHHFISEGYESIRNAILLAVSLASRTSKLCFGCGFNVLPEWHPLRLAEDYALADRLTAGRVRFGVARGYQAREVETFGSPVIDDETNR